MSKNKIFLIIFSFYHIFSGYAQTLVINEFMASNSQTITDDFGNYDDWVEIYNPTTSAVDLAGYFITDDPLYPTKYRFDSGNPTTIIQPSGFILIWIDNQDLQGVLHTNFSLSAQGEFLALYAPDSTTLIDSVSFNVQSSDISFGRYPDNTTNWYFLAEPTPGLTNSPPSNVNLNPPLFSHTGGFFTGSFNLQITPASPNDTIRYTLDGSEPTIASSLYTVPLVIESRAGDTNFFSLIPPNNVPAGPSLFYPPTSEVFKATVVKARSFSVNEESPTVTQTFFVDPGIFSRYNMPLVSLSTNPENLFSDSTGIYVPGNSYVTGNDETGNYFNTGPLWERPAFFEYFDTSGVKVYEKNVDLRTHGAATRVVPQKTLRLYADGLFNYKFFSDKDITIFNTLLLRNSGNDRISTMFRDAFMSGLVNDMKSGMEYQSYSPVVVFIDGEYWGIHNIRERIDKNYLHYNTGVNSDSIDYLEYNGVVNEGDSLFYNLWYNFFNTSTLTDTTDYNYMATLMDMDNFIDYNIAEIYFANIDWPGNNRIFWRPKTPGGKFRWIVFDTDFGYGLETYNNFDHNTLFFATDPNGPSSPPSWPSNEQFATEQLRKLLHNEIFRNKFVNRFADMLNTTFYPVKVVSKINHIQNQYTACMSEHIERWSKPSSITEWNYNVQYMREFAQNRPHYVRQNILDYFNELEPLQSLDIDDTSIVVLNVSDTSRGYIQMNTILPDNYPWTGIYFNDIPIPVRAIRKPGYTFIKWAGTNITNPEIFVTLSHDTTLTALFDIDTNYIAKHIYINEFMASNTNVWVDNNNEYDDWIELYNPLNDTLDIGGFYISDDLLNKQKYQIPMNDPLTKIPPLGYLVLWADATPAQGVLHLGFKLSAIGESISIYNPSNTLVSDNISFGQQSDDISYGRYPDGSPNWEFFNTPTPEASNIISSIYNYDKPIHPYIYPNPCSENYLHLNDEVINISIYNTIGQLVISGRDTDKIYIAGLRKGLYIAKVNNMFSLKLIVQ